MNGFTNEVIPSERKRHIAQSARSAAIGQVLIEGNASNSMSLINVDGFSEGMYFLRLVDGEGDSETTKKIIIDRQ